MANICGFNTTKNAESTEFFIISSALSVFSAVKLTTKNAESTKE